MDFTLGIIVGAVLMYFFPRAWKEATAADRAEAMMQSGPRRRVIR